jgi:hypothetical protein
MTAVGYLLESAEGTMRRIVEAQRVLEAERRLNTELGQLEAVLRAVHMAFVLTRREQRQQHSRAAAR